MRNIGMHKIAMLIVIAVLAYSFPANAYYQPQEGRFMQRDPLGVNPAGGKQNPFTVKKQYYYGINLYEYVKSSPLFYSDSYGLMPGLPPVPGYDPIGNPGSYPKNPICCMPPTRIIPSDAEERPWNQLENEWITELNERRKSEGKEDVTINGFYRHCVSTCNVNKYLRCLGTHGPLRDALSFLAAMYGGHDYPPIDDNNERYDYLSDVFGIVLAASPTSCADSCGSAMSVYMAIVEIDLERRGE